MRPGIESVVVVIPARDEAATLLACLDAVDRAIARLRVARPWIAARTVVVAHRSGDATAALAREHAHVIELGAGDVGLARAVGTDEALRLTSRPAGSTWLAMTDADTIVPEHWLEVQVELADDGADVVVGTVTPDSTDFDAEQYAEWRRTHLPGRPNGHVHGANLGVRGDAYRASGGFLPIAVGEDVDLVERLIAAGAHIVASDDVDVLTSSRRSGRAAGGYAEWLHRRYG